MAKNKPGGHMANFLAALEHAEEMKRKADELRTERAYEDMFSAFNAAVEESVRRILTPPVNGRIDDLLRDAINNAKVPRRPPLGN